MKGLAAVLALLPSASRRTRAGTRGRPGARLCRSVRLPLRAGQYVDRNRAVARVWRVSAHRTIASLPPQGIALQVTAAIEHPPVAPRASSWPPAIRAGDVTAGLEGISARSGVYQRLARFGEAEAYVWAFFGRAHPTRARLAEANAELRTVRLG